LDIPEWEYFSLYQTFKGETNLLFPNYIYKESIIMKIETVLSKLLTVTGGLIVLAGISGNA